MRAGRSRGSFRQRSQTPSADQRAQGHAPCERQTGPGRSSTRTMPVMEVPRARRHRRGGTLDGLELAGRIHGWSFLSEPEAVDLDGDGELDLLAQILGAHGTEMSVLVEAKVRLRGREVRSWADQMADGRSVTRWPGVVSPLPTCPRPLVSACTGGPENWPPSLDIGTLPPRRKT